MISLRGYAKSRIQLAEEDDHFMLTIRTRSFIAYFSRRAESSQRRGRFDFAITAMRFATTRNALPPAGRLE